jgi:uncharacterized protein (DUF697 family)
MARKNNTDGLRSRLAQSLDSANEDSVPVSASQPTEIMSATVASNEPVTLVPSGSKQAAAQQLVTSSTMLAVAAGALPVPVWDVIAVTGIQLKMLADISAVYAVPFKDNVGKSAVASLVGGLAPDLVARGAVGALFKALPGIGSIVGAIAVPALAGGCTYAVGQVFIKHYESGGTLLTFSARDFQAVFAAEVKAGMKKVADIKV